MTIDKDYLDHYLLAPKPSPNEVSEAEWHDRSLRLVEQIDKEAEDVEEYAAAIPNEEDATAVRFNDFMATTLLDCFLTRNIEDLAFMESMYWFCIDVADDSGVRNMRVDFYHPGKLDPKVFDLFREYGASFARPLLESVLSE